MGDFNLPQCSSAPPVSKDNEKENGSANYSSVTHPSMHSRSKGHLETLFKKINSGVSVLPRIPLRLDPNIEFSDDEDEEPAATIVKKPVACNLNSRSSIFSSKANNKPSFSVNMKIPEPPVVNKSIFSRERKTVDFISSNDFLKSHLLSTSAEKISRKDLKPAANSKDFLHKFSRPNNEMVRPPSKQLPSETLYKNSSNDVPNVETYANTNKSISSLPSEVIEVNNKVYNVLSLLGSGGSCKVYSVYDTETKTLVAVKRVNLKETDPLIRKGYEQEIEYLKKMQNSNSVIKMFDYEYRENELLLVLEHGDIDFAKFLSNEAKLKGLTPLKIKFYWAQMLEAVADIHKYGIVHSDLKPANFLLVAGRLKLIDFGIATSVPEDKTSTFRDTQVGTLNYMSPEAITQMSADSKQPCFKIGVKSDVWSLGCILYNLVYGVTPFHSIKSLMQKIYAITNPNYEIPFKPLADPLLLDVLQSSLKRNPKERASVEELLNHPYLAESSSASSSSASLNPNILKQMQDLTPRRMRYISKMVEELSGQSNS